MGARLPTRPAVDSRGRRFGLVLLLAGVACAQVEPPSGGPVDQEVPRVAALSPDSAAVSVDPDTISFLFSKEMDEGSVQDWTFWAPPLPLAERSWEEGRRLDLILAAPLEDDQTYTVLLGEEVVDRRGIALGPWQAAFATGPDLDDGVIEGTVRGGRIRTGGVYLYVWSASDSISPEAEELPPPLRIAQADRSGRFRIEAIPRGVPLRLCAHYDARDDRAYDPDEDLLGCLEHPLRLDDTSRVESGVDPYLVLADEPGSLAGAAVDSSCLGRGETMLRRLAADEDSLLALITPGGAVDADTLIGFQGEPPPPVDTLAVQDRLARIDSLRVVARADSARCAPPIVVRLLAADSTLVEETRGDGSFAFSGISPGLYRITGFRDRDRNGRSDAGEARGAFPHPVELLPGREIDDLDFPLSEAP
ncbi:MAG: hypothetical protein GF346_05230 [Candidatus Eisenbacteria bacterium]|nr:hypothetical protein [Candidatus Latescibacterota bacterium]MBD3301829.1 hypothetical protein [Candidatus Eisenbacteria bacterium]